MSSLTRWVLAHKRTVVITWIVLTIAGMAAGPGVRRAQDRSSPSRTRRAGRPTSRSPSATTATGGDSAPLLPVVTLPRGQDGRLARACARTWRGSTRGSRGAAASARIASYASTGDRAFVSEDGRTAFALVYPQPDPDSAVRREPEAEKAAQRARSTAPRSAARRCT